MLSNDRGRGRSLFGRRLFSLFLGASFVIALFLFLHFRKSGVISLELGKPAKHYLVAELDFHYPDESATIIIRNEAANSVGKIYRVEEEEIRSEISNFQRMLTQNEALWRTIAKDGFDSLAVALSLLSSELLQSRFADLETIQRLHEISPLDLAIQTHPFYVYIPGEKLKGRLPPAFWDAIAKCFAEEGTPLSIISQIFAYFKQVNFKFMDDGRSRSALQRILTAKIPIQLTQVTSGERIVDQGEEVKQRHLVMLEAMKSAIEEKRRLADPKGVAGSLLLALIFTGAGIFYLWVNNRDILFSNRRTSLLIAVVLLNLLLASLVVLFIPQDHVLWIDTVRYPLLVPFSALLISCLFGLHLAIFATLFLVILFTLALPVEVIPFAAINAITSIMIALFARSISRRKELFFAALKAWFVAALFITAFHLYEENSFSISIFYEALSALIFLLSTVILTLGLLPLLEFTFQVMTNMTLMEWMDPSNKLLQKLMREAPGTYQHSLLVGNLSEACALSIGANALFCRASALYHDIGKLANPGYFTENSQGVDMHQLLTPEESAKVIIGHVDEGVKIAKKEGLPDPFIDVIREHHGTSLVSYFYHKEQELATGKLIFENDYRYSGPRPQTKESMIIMIADSLEAAVRSMDGPNEEIISKLVDTLTSQKYADSQFDDAPLSFEELTTIKSVLSKNLLALRHPRIKYPPHHPGEEG